MASTPSRRTPSRKQPKRKKPALTAATADKHTLYQKSVQDPETEIAFIDRVFRAHAKRKPVSLREDFCGTALLTATWLGHGDERWSIGIDIDARVLAWAKRHNLASLGEPGQRVQLYCQDVRDKVSERVDVIGAFNFSYWVFKTREALREYFTSVRRGLNREGLFILDAYGGWESQEPMQENRPIRGGFTYVWDQSSFDPISHRVVNYIHFRFKDGSKLPRAFTYDWRYWTLPELSEVLQEAGFHNVRVYWDTSDDNTQEAYRVQKSAPNQPGWLAYLVASP